MPICTFEKLSYYFYVLTTQQSGEQQQTSLPHPVGGISSQAVLPQTSGPRDQTAHGMPPATRGIMTAIPGRTITSTPPGSE